ncbi:gamma carbonic anhydrase family protein [Longimicrobium sp.]|uniref:gamma carbonic anhydrase family protein n=1 Tax=Longimicrobium sp. TaxID=2029185 RepID=UPI002C458F5E|nr:gamma carbonic anhydrase family protein [Longimicrobium sp.]HSU16462.1 gamma carbonic anhydrase family protein [Longimicrobium sp.]
MANILPYNGVHPRIHPSAFIAPTAVVIGNVTIGEEASVWFGAVIRGDEPDFEIAVGARTSIQDNVVLHVSRQGATVIGADVTVGHGAILESCVVGDGALIGMNAVVLQRAVVGEQALVAAGAVVGSGSTVPPRSMAAGTPAVVKKELQGESLRWVSTSAAHYVELSRTYLAQGIGRVDGRTGDGKDG